MTSNNAIARHRKKGKLCMSAFIAITLGSDVLIKTLAFIMGTLRFSQISGSVITVVLLFFLWRGSQAAWWLTLACLLLTIGFCLFLFSPSSWLFSIGMLIVLAFLLSLLVLPSSREFLECQRNERAERQL
jgi:hypothetical protein